MLMINTGKLSLRIWDDLKTPFPSLENIKLRRLRGETVLAVVHPDETTSVLAPYHSALQVQVSSVCC